ncbi:exodeoxyribonuclease VII large subunit [Nitrosophilus kaiyonis]|uniref:exodeoxyribonuclease VII large subunit n=1 Tax=Nitrosophilus kaiyonis TaxID=2930200 RepID=UPI0024906290|nr:exodeoxyribonuclease VII large subunit [Nitrosophilus kaiyonis]
MNIITVSELNEKIKNLLESHFIEVYVEGEISRPTYHTSGHLYFSLKDELSVIRAVMFRSYVRGLDFKLEDGLKVIVSGKIGVYKPRGEYQLYATKIHLSGTGSLALAFEQLKKRLEAKGYFKKERKKEIPKYIDTIAIVTSRTGAALQDMLRVVNNRWPLVKIYIINSLVQGKEAAKDIADSIKIADSLGADVMIIGRGGGSLEDLWCFNEEIVADAIYRAKTPIVSAVGHEIDYLISDFVADLRAPTPSAAMEMILPDKYEALLNIDALEESLKNSFKKINMHKFELLSHMYKSFEQLSPKRKLKFYENDIKNLLSSLQNSFTFYIQKQESQIPRLKDSLSQTMKNLIFHKSKDIEHLKEKIENIYRSKEIKKGFAQVVKNKKVVDLKDIEIDDIFELQTKDVVIEAKALSKKNLS